MTRHFTGTYIHSKQSDLNPHAICIKLLIINYFKDYCSYKHSMTFDFCSKGANDQINGALSAVYSGMANYPIIKQ